MTDNQRLFELAIKGLELERQRINEEMTELRMRLNGDGATSRQTETQAHLTIARRRRRKLTAVHRKALSLAAKKRWAEKRRA
jgi:hypothetical protein